VFFESGPEARFSFSDRIDAAFKASRSLARTVALLVVFACRTLRVVVGVRVYPMKGRYEARI
jgi:hypothetical protein